ncbi:MAG: sulfatase [Gemmataceae bacterium]
MLRAVWAIVGCLLLGGTALAQTPARERPNFVILLTDDQRADAMGCAGNKLLAGKTPNMDLLAKDGIRFTNMFVTTALDAPSRATLLTGLYAHSHGVKDNQNPRLAGAHMVLSDQLRAAGYEVAFCGKSHLTGALRDRTWDYYFGYQDTDYHDPKIAESVNGKIGKDQVHEGYVDDIVTDKAVEYLAKKRDKPFCLFLWFKAPGRSWQRARRHHDLFRDVVIPKPITYDEDLKKYPDKPKAFVNANIKIGPHADVRSLDFVKDYYAALVAVDENIGKVMTALDKSAQLDSTVVLLTSDNGCFHGEFRLFDKRLMYEPSIRVPLIIRCPKTVGKPGQVIEVPLLNIDIAPTILELAGLPIPKNMHGRSLAPLLKADKLPAAPAYRPDWLYEYFDDSAPHNVRKHRGIRNVTANGEFKLIHYYEDPQEWELYHLTEDPHELKNVAKVERYRTIFNQLKLRIEGLQLETGDK